MKAKMTLRFGILFGILLTLVAGLPASAQEGTPTDDAGEQFIGDPRYPPPEFATGLDWINVSRPLTLQDLRGKVVILDFWTYGCINCIHMMPVMQQLEDKYGDALAIVGVHSAKFANEGQTVNIRQIVQRYGLKHA